jgi:hypothetical protein
MRKQPELTKKGLALLCLGTVSLAGCFTRKAPARPPIAFIGVVHPIVPPPTEEALEAPPDIPVEVLPELPDIAPTRLQPPKPRVAPPVAQEVGKSEKPVAPTITPEVDTEELRAAQTETQRSLDVAERNLVLAQGRTLNPMQQDLVSKVRGFADNAREAMKSGDWVRAKNLSTKAQVLAEQLAASF